jgi:hypothetical protein
LRLGYHATSLDKHFSTTFRRNLVPLCTGVKRAEKKLTFEDGSDILTSTAYMNNRSPHAVERIVSEKLTIPKPANKFLSFYGTRKFIAVFTTARHLSLY